MGLPDRASLSHDTCSTTLLPVLAAFGPSRPRPYFLTLLAVLPSSYTPHHPSPASTPSPITHHPSPSITLRINGAEHGLEVEPRVTLLDALRERLDLTGAKKGCDHGQCGACTVLIDGQRVLSCLTLAIACEGQEITTIEGIASDGRLHPLQQAFIDHDAFQCGFCTPGQILSGIACIREGHAGDDDELREFMSGNLCRCAAYPNIVAAIRQVAGTVVGGGDASF